MWWTYDLPRRILIKKTVDGVETHWLSKKENISDTA